MSTVDAEFPAGINLSGLVPFLVGSLVPLASMKLLRYAFGRYSGSEIQGTIESIAAEHIISGNETRKLLIIFGTVTGTASEMATALYEDLLHIDSLSVGICNAKDFNDEDFDKQDIVIFICCTWSEGAPPESAAPFMTWLLDMAQDFRVSKNAFENISFSAFGLGSKVYGGKMFCKPVSISVFSIYCRHNLCLCCFY